MNHYFQTKPGRTIYRIIFWILVLLLSYTIIGFLALPPIIKVITVKNIEKNVNREISINIVMFNPYTLSLTMKGLSIKEKNGISDFVSIKDIYVDLQSISIFKFAPIIKSVTVDQPHLSIIRDKDGKFSFDDLIEAFTTETVSDNNSLDKDDNESEMFQFSLSNLQITNGNIAVFDKQFGKGHKIDEINLSVPFTSTIGLDIKRFTKIQLSMNFDNAALSIFGKSKPFTETMETSIDVRLNGLDITNYFEYIPFESNLLLSSANIDTENTIYFANTKENGAELSIVGDIFVKELAIIDKQNNPFFNLGLNHITLTRSNLLKGDVAFGNILIESPHLWINRSYDGAININKLIEQLMPGETQEPTTQPQESLTPFNQIALKIENLDIKDSRLFLKDSFQTTTPEKPASMEILKMEKININNIVYKMANESVTIGEVKTDNGQFYAQRLPNGDFNIDLFTNIGVTTSANTTGEDLTHETPFLVELENLMVNNFSSTCRDIADGQDEDIVVDVVNMSGTSISTRPNAIGNINLTCKLNETANIYVNGEVCMDPIKANMKLNVENIDLTPYQPFISYFMEEPPNIVIASGRLSSDGEFSFALSEENEISGGFNGNATVEDFLLYDNNSEKLVEFGELNINEALAKIEPISANVKSVAINNFNCFAAITEEGSINLLNIFPETKTVDAEHNNSSDEDTEHNNSSDEGTEISKTNLASEIEDTIVNYIKAYPINLDELSIDKSGISFIDFSISPNFSMKISDISGTLTNFSTEKSVDAKIEVNAKINNYAPAKIEGSINLLKEKPFANITVQLNDMDLTPLSPYTGKYIGYNVHKGKLNIELSYLIELINLDSTNNLMVDQFELGQRVESPDAIKVPIKLGLALLKDRKGQIKLEVPLSGRIDDPEFKIGRIIVKTIKNLIVKAAASPFKFIASAFGGSKDIKHIEFPAGSSILSSQSKLKLDTIIKALYERPGIDLEISGFIDKTEDTNTMISNQLIKMIKNEKLKETSNSGITTASIDDINLEANEYEKYLRKLYNVKYATNEINQDKTRPEIEAFIKSKIEITESEIKFLINNRIQSVNSYILDSAQVESERIFLVEAQNISPKKAENIKDSRVELGLK